MGNATSTAEETIEHIKRDVAISNAKAIKFKLGGRMSHPEYPVGRSEKLIPLVRKTFGDQMVISADANGSYTAAEAIPIGKLMQDISTPSTRSRCPSTGTRRQSGGGRAGDPDRRGRTGAEHAQLPLADRERWTFDCAAGHVLFGGMVRCMQVARMANAFGKQCIPHISSTGLGYVYMMHFVSAIPNSGPYHEFKEFNTGCRITARLRACEATVTA